MDDLQIIDLFFSRDVHAIKEVDEKYGKVCKHISYNILGNCSDADECVNDAYFSLWNAIPPERPNNLMAFVCKIARNLSLKRLRFNQAEKRSQYNTMLFSELEYDIPVEVPDSVENQMIAELISIFLRNEKPDARNVFIRRYWYCDSISDIADRYDFSESKVKSMLFHTRKKLSDYLKKEGITL